MNKLNRFDVLVVYTESLAVSASGISEKNTSPFPKGSKSESYNVVYGYFLEVCERNGIRAALTTSADIIGAGCCSSYWLYKNGEWYKDESLCCANLIFDKFSPTRTRIKNKRKLLFSSEAIKPFNDADLFELFFDKQKTYERLFEYSIPTLSVIDTTLKGVEDCCELMKQMMKSHVNADDFTSDIVMKDRFGAGGRNVYKFKSGQTERMTELASKNKKVSYIIQPFAKFDLGFCYRDKPKSTDIRLVYLGGRIVQSYIREAKEKDFRCNEHQGGSLTYIPIDEVPENLLIKSDVIARKLDKKCSLFALDFIISNNGNVYLLEGNTGPGLDWNMSLLKNEIEAKKLIGLVVAELVTRVKTKFEMNEKMVPNLMISSSRLSYSGLV